MSTALHDFFGVAVVEAMYCDCLPLLPNRLAYPQFIPAEDRAFSLYDTDVELVQRLAWAAGHIAEVRAHSLRPVAAAYDWGQMAPVYDERFAGLAARQDRLTI